LRKEKENDMAKKQTEIEGTERKKIASVEDAAKAYREVRNKRQKLSIDEAAAYAKLEAAIVASRDELDTDDEGRPTYVYDVDDCEVPMVVTYEAETKVRVRKMKEAEAS
jgi:hypothetical protein